MVNFSFSLEICCEHNTALERIDIHYSDTFYSIILLFFVLKMFGFN